MSSGAELPSAAAPVLSPCFFSSRFTLAEGSCERFFAPPPVEVYFQCPYLALFAQAIFAGALDADRPALAPARPGPGPSSSGRRALVTDRMQKLSAAAHCKVHFTPVLSEGGQVRDVSI